MTITNDIGIPRPVHVVVLSWASGYDIMNRILTLMFRHFFGPFSCIESSILDQKSVLTYAMIAHWHYIKESVFSLHALFRKVILKRQNFQVKSKNRLIIFFKGYICSIISDAMRKFQLDFFSGAAHTYLARI